MALGPLLQHSEGGPGGLHVEGRKVASLDSFPPSAPTLYGSLKTFLCKICLCDKYSLAAEQVSQDLPELLLESHLTLCRSHNRRVKPSTPLPSPAALVKTALMGTWHVLLQNSRRLCPALLLLPLEPHSAACSRLPSGMAPRPPQASEHSRQNSYKQTVKRHTVQSEYAELTGGKSSTSPFPLLV